MKRSSVWVLDLSTGKRNHSQTSDSAYRLNKAATELRRKLSSDKDFRVSLDTADELGITQSGMKAVLAFIEG